MMTKKEKIAYENGKLDAIEEIIKMAENRNVESLLMIMKVMHNQEVHEYARLCNIEVLEWWLALLKRKGQTKL